MEEERECLLHGFEPTRYGSAEFIGRGSYGDVVKYTIIRVPGSTSVAAELPKRIAVKKVKFHPDNDSETKSVRREYKILKMSRFSRHPNILELFYWEIVKKPTNEWQLRLYTELCDMNLTDFMKEKTLSPHVVKVLGRQLIEGCAFLHDKGVIHRDIKPSNVLVTKSKEEMPSKAVLKLGDFGLARFTPQSVRTDDYSAVGSRNYCSPEMLHALDSKDRVIKLPSPPNAPDIFSLAVVLFEMFTGRTPFSQKDVMKQAFFTKQVARAANAIKDPNIKLGIKKMFEWDPKKRPTARKVLEFFSYDYKDLDEACKSKNLSVLKQIRIGELASPKGEEIYKLARAVLHFKRAKTDSATNTDRRVQQVEATTDTERHLEAATNTAKSDNEIGAKGEYSKSTMFIAILVSFSLGYAFNVMMTRREDGYRSSLTPLFGPARDSVEQEVIQIATYNNLSRSLEVIGKHRQSDKLTCENKCHASCACNSQKDPQRRCRKKESQYNADLFLAASLGHAQVVKNFLSQPNTDVNQVSKDGATPLFLASQLGHDEVVKVLLEKKADVNKAAGTAGVTPLFIASKNGHSEIVKILINYEADAYRATKCYENAPLYIATDGCTPLVIAARKGHYEVVSRLLEVKDVMRQENMGDIKAALLAAAANGSAETVRLLLETHSASKESLNQNGASPLHMAAQNGHCEVVSLLLQDRIDVNQEDYDGETALFKAARNGHIRMIRLLLEGKADVNKANRNGDTPLHAAVVNGHSEIFMLLRAQHFARIQVRTLFSLECTLHGRYLLVTGIVWSILKLSLVAPWLLMTMTLFLLVVHYLIFSYLSLLRIFEGKLDKMLTRYFPSFSESRVGLWIKSGSHSSVVVIPTILSSFVALSCYCLDAIFSILAFPPCSTALHYAYQFAVLYESIMTCCVEYVYHFGEFLAPAILLFGVVAKMASQYSYSDITIPGMQDHDPAREY